MIILQILSVFIWLIFIPFGMGLLPAGFLDAKRRTPGVVLLFGYIIMLAVFELIAIPIVIGTIYHGMTVLLKWFMPASLILTSAGIVRQAVAWRRGERLFTEGLEQLKKKNIEEKAVWIIFLLLLGFQLYMAFTKASFDGDDAYYVVQSLTAQQQDVLYRIAADTGKSNPLDMRHALAVFPLWIAYVAMKSDIHATIVTHSIVPLVLIPLTFLLYFQIGKRLLKKKMDMLPMFMVIMALMQIFGNVSIYTNETFLLTRTWQGKSFAANFIIPAVLWLFLWIFETGNEEEKGIFGTAILWIVLGMVNMTAGIGSSQAVLLCAMLTCIFGFFMMIIRRNFWVLVKAGLTCIPNAVYILLYLILTR